MSWFDSRSFTGLLSQAQKSIDKVLDIPSEVKDGKEGKRQKPTETGGQLNSTEHQGNKSEDKNSSGSWLSGGDSFWGSLVSQEKPVSDKEELEKGKTSLEDADFTQHERAEIAKEGECPKKSAKISATSRSQNSKRNNGKRSSKKKNVVNVLDEPSKQNGDTKGKNNEIVSNKLGSLKDARNSVQEVVSFEDMKAEESYMSKDPGSVAVVNVKSVNECSKTQNDEISFGLSKDDENKLNSLVKSEKEGEYTQSSIKIGKDFLSKEKDNCGGEREVDHGNFNEEVDIKKHEERRSSSNKDKSRITCEELDSFGSPPLAASTPCANRTKENVTDENDFKKEIKFANNVDLIEASGMQENQSSVMNSTSCVEKKTQEQSEVEKSQIKMPETHFEKTNEDSGENEMNGMVIESLKRENEKLLQIIEVRESKLVELSKENLNHQETNAILRSQLEQIEEVHKIDDSEYEQMKEEFTNRISTSETKLQAAAKERDLYKKQLEETQKCLSSDNERQLKEFQLLSREKDEQIAQLMQEGENLSKQILQSNNNMKKLRAKEKESNLLNKKLSTRLGEAESEIERLTGILKERDEHEKNQEDAIKKLNDYIKKQDEQIAKQKVELEESSAKLPSLQTALDNAYKEITELHKENAAKSNAVQEATLSVEMNAKEELRMAMEKIKKESQKECDVLAMEVTDLQMQMSRSEQRASRREDNLRQEIADLQMRLQEAETRNQELTESVSIATRPLLRQIENLQHSYGSQQTSWEKLERNLTERLAEAQSQQASAQEKERAATERSLELNSQVASLESLIGNYRQEKSRIEAQLEIEKAKLEELEDFKSRETGKIEALKAVHSKQLETMMVEKTLLEQQLVVERTKLESLQKKISRLQEQLSEKLQKSTLFSSKNESVETENEDEVFTQTSQVKGHSRNTSTSSQFSLTDTINRGLASGSTAALEELHATIRHKDGELSSMQSAISTLEASRESLTKELTTLMATNENLVKENEHLHHFHISFQELQTKYNALLQMYGEKQEETEELKLDLQDIKMMYKAQIQELLSGR